MGALQSYSGSGIGTILVFIETQYYSPTSGSSVQGGGDTFASIQVSGQATIGSLVVTGGATIGGDLAVTGNASIGGNLTVNGHIITGGSTPPTVTIGSASCANETVKITGNDTAGTVTITTDSDCTTTGSLAIITFGKAYGSAPHITLTPTTAAAASLEYYNGSSTSTSFTIDSATLPKGQTTYTYTYHVEQ